MTITSTHIHPSIGIARLGDSPDGFFIGPEKPGEKPDPEGGFKDDDCRVKRQGARFRVFATHNDGTVEEITDEDADIDWSVHLANKKASTRSQPGSASDLTINPGKATVKGPNERAVLDSGTITFPPDPDPEYPSSGSATVPLGEIRTDTNGRLIVLGGHGNSGSPTGKSIQEVFHNKRWYDDASDGPVTAEVTMSDSGDTYTAEGAWVVVAPPKFSPGLDNVITLYDRLFHLMVNEGYVSAPSTPSYTEDIYPILERADKSQWVTYAQDNHHSGSLSTGGSWSQPVYDSQSRQRIFSKMKSPGPGSGGGNMPPLASGTDMGRLTATQYEMMRKWKNDNFQRDWSGPPSPPSDVTPDGMDEAALENGVGAAFYPGIEVGGFVGTRVILDPPNYKEAFRLDHSALGPGDVTKYMSIPWQTDFYACGTNWWPVPRPNDVLPENASSTKKWDRRVSSGADMVSKWSDLGFVVEQQDQYVEVDRCGIPYITLLTPTVDFGEVPQGPMGASRTTAFPIEFEVNAPSSSVTLSVQSGPSHPNFTAVTTSKSVGPTSGSGVETARLWIQYRTQSPGNSANDTVTITAPGAGETWTVDLTAKTVGRKTAATSLVLDRSGSMDEDRGDGKTKHESLEEAASIFVDVMLEGDGVGIVRYNEDAQVLQNITKLGPAGTSDPARTQTKNIITGSGLDPQGSTSIGDGIYKGRSTLNAGYDVESLVVLTDGKENEPRSIADVAGSIDEQTYSVGLGQPSNTSAPALQNISGNTGGYLLVTGNIGTDEEFILKKYFLQILSGVSNADVVLDPEGTLTPGAQHRIPFTLTDVDNGLDVILLTDEPGGVDFRLETPYGNVIEPWRANSDPTMRWVLSDSVAYYRLSLPVELMEDRFERHGQWHALLSLGNPQLEPDQDEEREEEEGEQEYEEYRERQAEASGQGDQPMPFLSQAMAQSGEQTEFIQREELAFRQQSGKSPPAYATHADHPGAEHFQISQVLSEADIDVDADGLRYSLLVHTYSNLTLDARVQPTGYEPGDELRVVASVTESGIPVESASVRARVTRPNGTTDEVRLDATEGSEFRGTVDTTVPGVYEVRVSARGQTRSGLPFQREHVATGATWGGGAHDADVSQSGDRAEPDQSRLACELLRCLSEDVLDREQLSEHGIDVGALRECLQSYCEQVDGQEREEETQDGLGQFDFPVGQFEAGQMQDLLNALMGGQSSRESDS